MPGYILDCIHFGASYGVVVKPTARASLTTVLLVEPAGNVTLLGRIYARHLLPSSTTRPVDVRQGSDAEGGALHDLLLEQRLRDPQPLERTANDSDLLARRTSRIQLNLVSDPDPAGRLLGHLGQVAAGGADHPTDELWGHVYRFVLPIESPSFAQPRKLF